MFQAGHCTDLRQFTYIWAFWAQKTFSDILPHYDCLIVADDILKSYNDFFKKNQKQKLGGGGNYHIWAFGA